MPRSTGILETCLHVADLARSIEFYRDLFDWPVLASDDRFAAFAVVDKQVLLLFLEGASEHDMQVDGGVIPGHGGEGRLHVAFAIPATTCKPGNDAWQIDPSHWPASYIGPGEAQVCISAIQMGILSSWQRLAFGLSIEENDCQRLGYPGDFCRAYRSGADSDSRWTSAGRRLERCGRSRLRIAFRCLLPDSRNRQQFLFVDIPRALSSITWFLSAFQECASTRAATMASAPLRPAEAASV